LITAVLRIVIFAHGVAVESFIVIYLPTVMLEGSNPKMLLRHMGDNVGSMYETEGGWNISIYSCGISVVSDSWHTEIVEDELVRRHKSR
jgi:hypothetical protein